MARRWSRSAAVGASVLVLLLPAAGLLSQPGGGPAPASKKASGGPRDWVQVGGVRRKASDVRRAVRKAPAGNPARAMAARAGRVQPIRAQANPHVASVAEALRTKKFPERVSTLIRPRPFDRKAYQRAPEAYCRRVEPGRVFQSAQPGPGVVRLRSVGRTTYRVVQGEVVRLRVRAVPGAPVTFTSFDLGAFQNELPSITVRADGKGVAEARFRGTPGTYNRVDILAASPMTSGRVRFCVFVELPRAAAAPADSGSGNGS